MPTRQIKKFLDERNIEYESIKHSTAFTAQEMAQSLHVQGGQVAKTVVVKTDVDFVLIVLPATRSLDLEKFQAVSGATSAQLAKEWQFQEVFPGCDAGAMPPLGPLYAMDVYMDSSFTMQPSIYFNAGTHEEAICMSVDDFTDLVGPVVADLAMSTQKAAARTQAYHGA